jgi:hypothetical protein
MVANIKHANETKRSPSFHQNKKSSNSFHPTRWP